LSGFDSRSCVGFYPEQFEYVAHKRKETGRVIWQMNTRASHNAVSHQKKPGHAVCAAVRRTARARRLGHIIGFGLARVLRKFVCERQYVPGDHPALGEGQDRWFVKGADMCSYRIREFCQFC
jgi:hypothetical protein